MCKVEFCFIHLTYFAFPRHCHLYCRTNPPLIVLHFWSVWYLLLSSHVSSVLVSGHLLASRGVRDDHSYWRHHREPVLPGQQRATEPLQGSGSGTAVGGSDGLDPAPGCRLSGTAGVERGCGGAGRFRDLLRVSVSCVLVITAGLRRPILWLHCLILMIY